MKTREELHESALALLSLIKEADNKVHTMIQHNVDIAYTNGFEPHSEESIDFQKQLVERLKRSYKNVVNQIMEEVNIDFQKKVVKRLGNSYLKILKEVEAYGLQEGTLKK